MTATSSIPIGDVQFIGGNILILGNYNASISVLGSVVVVETINILIIETFTCSSGSITFSDSMTIQQMIGSGGSVLFLEDVVIIYITMHDVSTVQFTQQVFIHNIALYGGSMQLHPNAIINVIEVWIWTGSISAEITSLTSQTGKA